MFGIRFVKARPTEFVMLFKRGKAVRRGEGLSFFYYAPRSSVVVVPLETRDVLFIFKENSADFQECDIQGQLTYRIREPEKITAFMDFSIGPHGQPSGEGVEKLPDRLTGLVQVVIREKLGAMPLREALTSAGSLMAFARDRLRASEALVALGIEVVDFSIVRLAPTPEMARALEAGTREQVLKAADEAIYERRNFAVEQERRIKENELQTQISIEEKNRQIREEQMNAEIAVQQKQRLLEENKLATLQALETKRQEIEEQKLGARTLLEGKREELVKAQSKNQLEFSRARAESLRLEFEPLRGLEPALLDVLATNQMDARQLVGRAMKELAGNAAKIGTLNISPELLPTLLGQEDTAGHGK